MTDICVPCLVVFSLSTDYPCSEYRTTQSFKAHRYSFPRKRPPLLNKIGKNLGKIIILASIKISQNIISKISRKSLVKKNPRNIMILALIKISQNIISKNKLNEEEKIKRK